MTNIAQIDYYVYSLKYRDFGYVGQISGLLAVCCQGGGRAAALVVILTDAIVMYSTTIMTRASSQLLNHLVLLYLVCLFLVR
jgi:hypothetical protein